MAKRPKFTVDQMEEIGWSYVQRMMNRGQQVPQQPIQKNGSLEQRLRESAKRLGGGR